MKYATEDDIGKVLGFVSEFWNKTRYADIAQMDMNAVEETVRNLILADDGCVLISDKGALCGIMCSHFVNPDMRFACELMWYGDGDLLDGFERWAGERGARYVSMIGLQDDRARAISRIYRRNGYELVENTFMKVFH